MSNAEPLSGLLHEWMAVVMRRSLRNMMRYMRENELSMTQIGALFQIHRGRTNVSDLAERLGVTTAAASQMLERLVQQDLIRRSEDPEDRRAKRLVLTDKGYRIVQRSLQARQGWLEAAVSGLSAREREQVAAAVKILIERARQVEEVVE